MPKFYPEQFKRDAVALYENNENLSLAATAAELGVNRASLHQWKKELGTGKRTRMIEAKAQAGRSSLRRRTYTCAGKRKRKTARRTRYFAQGCEIFCQLDTLAIRFQVCRGPQDRVLGQADVHCFKARALIVL